MVKRAIESQPRPTEVRERILEHTIHLFAARGFDGTTLQEIADAVGVSKQSVLYYFPSKDALRLGVLEKVLAHWNEVVPRLLMAATSSHGQFDGILDETIAFFSADPDRARFLLREVLDRPREIRELTTKHVRPWVGMTCEYIRTGQAKGRLWSEVDAEAYIAQIINLIISSIATWEALGTTDRERDLVELRRVAKSSLFRPHPLSSAHKE